MNDVVQILLWPALACLVLTGIHAYLGLHVVERGVIFVDLSLAQVASLGTTIALLMGFDMHSHTAYFISLAFTLLGAAVFSIVRSEKSRVPQEAFIGIVYAVSAAAAVLIMDRLPEGAEHIKYILVGNLLAVTPHEVLKMAGLYSLIGVVHYAFRKPFLTISTQHGRPIREIPYNVRWWDFLFYATFGFVVTSSVAIAGVLLVFSFLIVPSVSAMLFSEKVGKRLAFGWIMGTIVSLIGMVGSYELDAPTGATVVCTFGIALLILGAVRPFILKKRRRLVAATAAAGAFLGILTLDSRPALAESDPMACVREIQNVCVQLQDKLETCLADRGSQLSTTCRDQLKTAVSAVQDPSGPAACIPDVQRLCPRLEAEALGQCITDNEDNFSKPCRTYLQTAAGKK